MAAVTSSQRGTFEKQRILALTPKEREDELESLYLKFKPAEVSYNVITIYDGVYIVFSSIYIYMYNCIVGFQAD